nr:sulfatase-like hydrolase/transferase [uncultured Psychroserpens sp.]
MKFINSNKSYALLAGFASGCYALLYLYDRNFTLVNSWSQFLFFLLCFCIAPAVITFILHWIFKNTSSFKTFSKYIVSILNCAFFAVFIMAVTQGFEAGLVLFIACLTGAIVGALVYKHINKIIVFQLLLSVFMVAKLVPNVYRAVSYSYDWQKQDDDILNASFVKTPNIYYLQPDGYVDFEDIKLGHYKSTNDDFKSFLLQKDFVTYSSFRSNYRSTLSSNTSIFSMSHHYYNHKKSFQEFTNAREIITVNNPVLDIFKSNKYKTNLILDNPYLVVNRPKLTYDYCNINYNDIPYLSKGNSFKADNKKDLLSAIDRNRAFNNFYFVRYPIPGHIHSNKSTSKGKVEEREQYFKDLKLSNVWLKDVVDSIIAKDKNALIIISSDHGGYVGYDYTAQHKIKSIDPDLTRSIFSTVLAIRWPENETPEYHEQLKTSVNLFRVLFSYLSENEAYLDHLAPDKSFDVISENAPFGVYEVINEKDEVVFEKVEK